MLETYDTAINSITGQKLWNKQFLFYIQGASSSANLSVFTSAFLKWGFQALRNTESSAVAVVQEPESKCLETWWAVRLFNTLQFIVVTLMIHLVKCHKTGQQEEHLQNADWGYA